MGVPEITPRAAGYALYGVGAYVREVPSCLRCAKLLGATWVPALFEGECQGCEIALTGNPIAG